MRALLDVNVLIALLDENQHGARFVSVDRAVSLASVRGATEEFLVTI